MRRFVRMNPVGFLGDLDSLDSMNKTNIVGNLSDSQVMNIVSNNPDEMIIDRSIDKSIDDAAKRASRSRSRSRSIVRSTPHL